MITAIDTNMDLFLMAQSSVLAQVIFCLVTHVIERVTREKRRILPGISSIGFDNQFHILAASNHSQIRITSLIWF